MLSEKFTLLELLDLALLVPEAGAINVNILHTVLSHLITELKMDQCSVHCFIQDEGVARAAINKSKLQDPQIKTRESVTSSWDVKDITDATDIQKNDLEEVFQSMLEDIEEKESNKLEKSGAISSDKDTEQAEKTKELEKSQSKQAEKTKESEESHSKQTDETKEPEESQSKKAKGAKESEESHSKPKQSADLTKGKDLKEVTDKVKEAEVRAVAEEILKRACKDRSTEEQAGIVATQTLKLLTEDNIFEADPAKSVQETFRLINMNGRMDGAEETINRLTELMDVIIGKIIGFEQYMLKRDKLDGYFERIQKLESRCEVLETKLIKTMEEHQDATVRKQDFTELVQRVDTLEKANLEMVMGKLDRSEFTSAMQDMEERIEKLAINSQNQ